MRIISLILAAMALASAPASAQTKASQAAVCNESCLLDIAGDYLDALTAHDPSTVPFASNLRATENDVPTKPGEGIWKTAVSWPYRHTITDPVTGGIMTFASVNEGMDGDKPKDALVVVRLKVVGKKITESELMVSRPGEFALFAPRALAEPKPIFTSFVPPEQRSTRAQLAEIGQSYFHAIIEGDSHRAPFHPDCNRLENGVQTTNIGGRFPMSCKEGMKRFPYMHAFRDVRIPVIDTQRGLVAVITVFDMPIQNRTIMVRGKPFEITPERNHLPRSLKLYELFKVEGGRIRSIEAMMRNGELGSSMGWGGAKGGANVIP